MQDIKRVIALGFFDGVHLGHGALMNMTRQRAEELSATPSVLSFDTHPDNLVFGSEVPLINSASDREDIIRRCFGINDVVFIHFDKHIMCMPWEEFVSGLIDELNVCHIVVGHDFCFGYKGEGTAEKLKGYCAEHGLGCDIIPAVKLDGRVISSTYIRELIKEGNMEEAMRYLGHPHCLSDTVRSGYHLGSKIGAPTINMAFPDGVLVPKHGVYAARVFLEDGCAYTAVTNIGVRPTVSRGETVSVESHLLDYSGNLYGRELRVEFYKFLRPEMKFSSCEELAEQIHRDAEEAKNYLSKN